MRLIYRLPPSIELCSSLRAQGLRVSHETAINLGASAIGSVMQIEC